MGRTRWGALVLLALTVSLGVACSADDAGDGDMGGATVDRAGMGPGEELAEGGGSAVPEAGRAGRAQMELPSVGPSVIKSADLHVEVEHDGFHDAFQSVVDLAQRKGGFVLSSSTSGDASRTGSITLRVPAEDFESALGEIAALGEVTLRAESGEDVSQEFVDLQARIRNLAAQESVMLRLMERATSISGTIRVQSQLTDIQLEIERLEGRLRYLEDRTALSTINVRLTEAGSVAPTEPGTVARAWDVARETTGAIVAGFLIGGAAITPVAVVLLLGVLVFRWVRPRVGRLPGA